MQNLNSAHSNPSTADRQRPLIRTLAIVPAHNESATVEQVVRSLRPLPTTDIVVVDDGSTDATAAIARKAGAIVVSFPGNLGVGAAVRAGLVLAHRMGYECAFQFDADGQHDADSIPRLLEPLSVGDADLVIGSRFLAGNYQVSRSRSLAMRMLRVVVRSVTGLRLSDPSSGFRAFSRRAIDELVDRYPTDYMDSVETIVLAHRIGLRVIEVPATMFEREHGASSASSFQAAWHTLRAVFSAYITHRRGPIGPVIDGGDS